VGSQGGRIGNVLSVWESSKYKGSAILFAEAAMNRDSYYSHVRGVYDRIAPAYDEVVGLSAVSQRAKQLALQIIKEVTPNGGRLLDIGCYTGIEALLLAQQGYHVLGIDLSNEMILKAEQKAKRYRVGDRARFRAMPAADVGQLQSDRDSPFDTAYSVYGTLNLEPQLQRFKEGLVPLLREGAPFVCGLLNPTVLYELVLGPLFGKFHGYRKLRKEHVVTKVGLGTETVETFLFSTADFARIMAPEFRLERNFGVHVLYPPPRHRQGRGFWWVARGLDRVERRVQSRFPFRELGFFSLLVFQRSVR